jgi:hypothetical protein
MSPYRASEVGTATVWRSPRVFVTRMMLLLHASRPIISTSLLLLVFNALYVS